jgi:hypothetical protein
MARGNARARKAMTSLAATMTQKQLRESESRVSVWQQRKKTSDPSAGSLATIQSSYEESSE